jgi:hypothetical protein
MRVLEELAALASLVAEHGESRLGFEPAPVGLGVAAPGVGGE